MNRLRGCARSRPLGPHVGDHRCAVSGMPVEDMLHLDYIASLKNTCGCCLQYQYLSLLDWTGRELPAESRGAIPGRLSPILERLGLNGECWLETVRHFGRWFKRAAGGRESLAAAAGSSLVPGAVRREDGLSVITRSTLND